MIMKEIINIFILLVSIICLVSCDTVASKLVKKAGKEVSEEIVETSSRAAVKSTAKVAAKSVAKNGVAIGKALKELIVSDKNAKLLYEGLSSRVSKDFADGIVVTTSKKGVEMVSEEFPTSYIRMNKNMIFARGGSLKNAGPVNEFLNIPLPNKTYLIDDAFTYQTDELGRVISCSADRTKAFNTIERNAQRHTKVQQNVVKELGGEIGDDGGHLFANNTGGLNELINQVPMPSELNRHGLWRELEMIEEAALKEGKQVISKRNLKYAGKSKRPYAIEFIYIIDGVENKVLVKY
jgi:hypothetical protein